MKSRMTGTIKYGLRGGCDSLDRPWCTNSSEESNVTP